MFTKIFQKLKQFGNFLEKKIILAANLNVVQKCFDVSHLQAS